MLCRGRREIICGSIRCAVLNYANAIPTVVCCSIGQIRYTIIERIVTGESDHKRSHHAAHISYMCLVLHLKISAESARNVRKLHTIRKEQQQHICWFYANSGRALNSLYTLFLNTAPSHPKPGCNSLWLGYLLVCLCVEL